MKNFLYKGIIFLFFCLLIFKIPCFASEIQNEKDKILNEQYNELEINKIEQNIPKETEKDLEEIGINPKNPKDLTNFDVTKIFSFIFSKSLKTIKTPLIIFANCLIIIIIASLFNSFKPTSCGTNLNSSFGVLIAICSFSIIISPLIECVTNISQTIKNFSNFMLSFIPVFAGIIAVSKGVISSIGYNSTIFIIAQIISSITADFLLPITGSFLALSISGSVNNSFNISALTSAVKKVVIFSLSLLVTIFVGVFTIQSTIATNADTIGVKTAKFLSGSFIPIIGSALGDAIASILGGLNIIKSAVGGLGIIVCIITLIPPILNVSFFIITTSLATEISKAFEITTMAKALAAIKDCLSILLANHHGGEIKCKKQFYIFAYL